MFIANDIDQFKNRFVSQLKNMLSADELGAFILVLANSQQDAFLKAELKTGLEKNFATLKAKFIAGKIDAAPDDVDVFNQLLQLEIDAITQWQSKAVGDWQIVYNAMRRLRPARSSAQVLTSIKQDFDASKFHFNKPFLKPEILWQGDYKNAEKKKFALRVLYNKYPFSDYHLLIVVAPEENSPQQLTEEYHQLAFSLVGVSKNIFPGFGIGFNSLAAGASVNHFHFQGFIREAEFPIEKKHWQHHGGKKLYPLAVKVFAEAETSWLYIADLIAADVAFNCIYRAGNCYVVARRYQGTVELPGWLNGAGWLDIAGVMTVSDMQTFDNLNAHSIADALALMAIV